MVLRLIRALPGVPGLIAPVAFERIALQDLTPASGRQDHAISPSAPLSLAWRYRRVHRILFQRPRRLAKRPSRWNQDAESVAYFSENRKR